MEQGFRVGAWLIQPDIGTVTRVEEQAQLEPKVMEVLVYLARHPNELLPKERIIQAVWPDTFVTDEVLTNAISELRKAFGDDARNPSFIQTLPRRGYRLIASVSSVEGAGEGHGSADSRKASGPLPRAFWRHPPFLVVGGGMLVTLAGLLIWQLIPTAPEGPIESIAILPFKNGTQGDEADYLCVEIPACLSARLSNIESLRVVPTGNLTRFVNEDVEPRSAADQLRVHAILRGWLTQIGEELSVRVELSDARRNQLLWGDSYHLPFKDVFEIEEEIAGRMAAALRLRLTPEQEARVSHRPTESIAAYEAYLKGRFLRVDERSPEGQRKAITYFEEAISKDGGFAEAYVELGRALFSLGFFTTSNEAFQRARQAFETALCLQPTLFEAQAALAKYDRDWAKLKELYRRRRDLDSDITPGSDYLLWQGRLEEALEEIERKAQRSDPLSGGQQYLLSWAYYTARDYTRALRYAEEAIRLGHVQSSRWNLVLCFQALGEREEAFAALLSDAVRNSETQAIRTQHERAFATGGLKGFWKQWADRRVLLKDKPYDIAGAYAFAGENDLALQWLEKDFEYPGLRPPFVTDARFDSLRDDPRYEQLLRKLNLPEEAIARHLAAGR